MNSQLKRFFLPTYFWVTTKKATFPPGLVILQMIHVPLLISFHQAWSSVLLMVLCSLSPISHTYFLKL